MSASPLAEGQAAYVRAAWADARACFESAAAADGSPEAWEGISRTAWWQGDQEATLSARVRAYQGYRRVEDARGAARMAMWVASDHLDFRGDDAMCAVWLRRARTLLDGHPPCAELGFVLLLEADVAMLAHSDPTTAARVARAALELARAVGEVGVLAPLDDLVDAVEPSLDVERLFGGPALHQSSTASRRMSSSILGFNPP